MKGIVFGVEEFSVYDGPGIRTTVFLKGCPLRCTWCHNPEGQNHVPEIVRSPNGCIGCNQCFNYAKTVDSKIVYTEESIKKCPMGLLRVSGEEISAHAICQKMLKNQKLLLNGGVTFSGGEPLMQMEFLLACLEELKGKLHTAIQTSGYCEPALFQKAVAMADYFLFDIKIIDDEQHRKYTGVSNKMILQNLSYFAANTGNYVVRIPLIPGVTDTDENISGIIQVLKENKIRYVELLPYNKLAGGKYKMLGREYRPGFDEQSAVTIPEKLLIENDIQFRVL